MLPARSFTFQQTPVISATVEVMFYPLLCCRVEDSSNQPRTARTPPPEGKHQSLSFALSLWKTSTLISIISSVRHYREDLEFDCFLRITSHPAGVFPFIVRNFQAKGVCRRHGRALIGLFLFNRSDNQGCSEVVPARRRANYAPRQIKIIHPVRVSVPTEPKRGRVAITLPQSSAVFAGLRVAVPFRKKCFLISSSLFSDGGGWWLGQASVFDWRSNCCRPEGPGSAQKSTYKTH